MNAVLNFDAFNIYVRSKVPTNRYLKAFLLIINISALVALFTIAIQVQDDKPSIFPFIFPIAYFLTIGRYLLWNTYGEEFCIISTTHISHQHNYGFWRSKLQTQTYDFISVGNQDVHQKNEGIRLIFMAYTPEKLPKQIFKASIPIAEGDADRILNYLNDLKINEYGDEVSFPPFFSN